MVDSDDEYDRKRRDKFRGERGAEPYRGNERQMRPRDDWAERDAWPRQRPRDYGGRVRERGYSPTMEPPMKRSRDYYGGGGGDGGGYYNHFNPYHAAPPHRELPPPVANPLPAAAPTPDGQPPPMMSFKAFLASQDDNISDNEAIEKYNEYKLDYQRQQLNEFFIAHKDDEWFRLKYHPEDSTKRKEEQQNFIKKRVEVFMELMSESKLKIALDCVNSNTIMKLLDTVVVKLESGTEEDFAALDKEYNEILKPKTAPTEDEKKVETPAVKSEPSAKVEDVNEMSDKNKSEDGELEDDEVEKEEKPSETNDKASAPEIAPDALPADSQMAADREKKLDTNENGGNAAAATEGDEDTNVMVEKNIGKKRKRSRSNSASSSGSSSDSSSSSTSDSEADDEDKKIKKKADKSKKGGGVDETKSGDNAQEVDTNVKADAKPEASADEVGEKSDEKPEIVTVPEDDKPVKKGPLHKTTSIFLRSLAPTITRQEIEAMCARYDGFLRVALADPQPERRWLRRGWVTFRRHANIKEICWNLNNIRLRDCELGAIMNRDLSRRIRAISGIVAHKQVVRSDIRISARVIVHMDSKAGLWPDDDDSKAKAQQSFGFASNNPILHNITDYLIEEASAEEDELLGLEPSGDDNNDSATIVDRDDQLIEVLDRMILYLRIVHSLDYYNHCEYPNEDEMPSRCGILHARGPAPTSKTDLSAYMGSVAEAKMSNFLPEVPREDPSGRGADRKKNEEKLVHMALKNVDKEIDKFVEANTRELSKDKWLCPLSGKKFKGPDFVRKHIFNKHAEKIDEVRKEVEFFNNYLRDLKRPMLQEPTPPKREEPSNAFAQQSRGYGGGGGFGGGMGGGGMGMYGMQRFYGQGVGGGYPRARGYAHRARGNSGGDYRPVVHYRDLDAPREPEEFI